MGRRITADRGQRRGERARAALLCLALAASAAQVRAQQEPSEQTAGSPELSEYLKAMAEARLLASETGSADAMRRLVRAGEDAHFAGRHDEAAVLLMEVVESPRFHDFGELLEYSAAESMLAATLIELGSLHTARRYLQRVIERGPDHPYFGPSVRRYTDSALLLGDPGRAAEMLEAMSPELSSNEDAAAELLYLKARARYDAGDDAAAAELLQQIGKRSRFYANAHYLRGAIAARDKRFAEAEARFCAVADTGADDLYSFYVDDRYFEVRDLARLGLGRVAHEQQRADDAFYYYFQVPQDSPRLAEAFFEAAYASYEGNQYDTAVDLLEQLEARFPESPFVDEAEILRGYVALSRCEFEEADRRFAHFMRRFGPLIEEIDRILDNPVRQDRFYVELLDAQRDASPDDASDDRRPGDAADEQRRLILSLIAMDPEFYRLHAELRSLDAEAARASRSAQALDAIAARLEGADRPRAASPIASEDDGRALLRELENAEAMAGALSEQLDAMRRASAQRSALDEAEREVAAAARDLRKLRRRLSLHLAAHGGHAAKAGKTPTKNRLHALVVEDATRAAELPSEVAQLRDKLVAAANARGLSSLRALRERLSARMGRARIGRIDAVMGSKRRIEIQIESLAAGRFPAELRDPLLIQGLLADDEEYWPFEGEDWPDEYEERFDLPEEPAQ